MEKTRLGRTGLMVTRTAFGALPIQRVDMDAAVKILRAAYDAGINFFDTARGYSDSEEKIGQALSGVRKDIIIATKAPAQDRKHLLELLAVSLKNMKTDYVDILQLHNPPQLPDPDDPESTYAGLKEAQQKGLARFIGISSHRLAVSKEMVTSGKYDTLQFPLSALSSDEDLTIIDLCQKHDIGLIAMKALSGGLITNAATTFAFLRQYKQVVPIWGIQRQTELDEFIALDKNPPVLDNKLKKLIKKDRQELTGAFCRGCGYCLPCPAEIPIPMAARMSLLLNRAPWQRFRADDWQQNMIKIEDCTECNHCKEHCPYELDTPALLKENLKYYKRFSEKHKI
jgi:aryl-alcohol dehydrogenase-like predicted oxidoreductase/Pyruvate/2-oxoacid:ferredoxin oxidoreductase delta subunit